MNKPEITLILPDFHDFNAARDVYYAHKLDYTAYSTERTRCIDSAVAKLITMVGRPEELAKVWFYDYGTMNGWDNETTFRYAVASKLHDIDKQNRPDCHKKLPQVHSWRCWEEDRCSCGLCSSCDSSD